MTVTVPTATVPTATLPTATVPTGATATSTTTPAPAEEVKKMKAQMGTGLPGAQTRANKEKYFINLSGGQQTVTEAELAMLDTVYIKNCTDFTLSLNATCTKVFIESCENLTVDLNDRVLTSTVEVWKCRGTVVNVNTKVQTFQLDMSTDTRITFRDKTHFDRLVWSASEQVHLTVGQVPTDALSSGSAPTITESATAESAPTEATTTEPDDYYTLSTGSSLQAAGNTRINAETDQFIVRLLPHKRTGRPHLLTELIVRLQNGFPTTEREAREFDARQEENLQKLAKEILGENVVLGRKKRDGPKVRPNDPCTCGGPKKFKKCCGAA